MRSETKDLASLRSMLESSLLGEELYSLIRELYPICRSITGAGFRETIAHIGKEIPLEVHEVPSGTQVFDWIVPKEWNIRDAYVKNTRGERIIDFRRHNLHVVNYRGEDEYEVCIDSALENGSLTYGECYLPGESRAEVLISCHACHPSLCNDNLSSVAVATFLAKYLCGARLRYSYRFLFIPGTIGAITWLSQNEADVHAIQHGLVLTCVGDRGHITYKKSHRGDAEIDRAVAHVLKHSGRRYDLEDFSPYGYDERQYCSPGFNLPVGCFMRTPHGKFPEYHSSADNLELMDPASLGHSLMTCLSVFYVLENNRWYCNQNPKCEPQLGRRGLYRAMGGNRDEKLQETAMLWVLNQSDGDHSLLDIAERSELAFDTVHNAASLLLHHGLLKEVRTQR